MSPLQSEPQPFPHNFATVSRTAKAHQSSQPIPSIDDALDPPHPLGNPIRCMGSVENITERSPLLQQNHSTPRTHEPVNDVFQVGSKGKIQSSQIYWEELGILSRYTLPIFATQIFEYSFSAMSVVVIGHLSTVHLAAATLGMMTASVTGYSIIQGITSALDTLLPPAWTSETPHMVGLWSQRMIVMTALILIPIHFVWFYSEPILLALKQDPEVAHLAAVYLRRYFQCQGLFVVPARIIAVVAPLNAFLNWFFVYSLGFSFRGAPIATALSFNIVSLASILYAYFFVPRAAWIPIGRGVWQGWGVLGRLGIAGIGQTASEWWTWELIGLATSFLGRVPLAAQSVLLVTTAFLFQAPFSLSIATSVRIGNLLGEGKARRAKIVAHTSIVVAVAIGCIWSITLLVFRKRWAYLFNDDPDVVLLVTSILPIPALFQVFDMTTTVAGGILRARGMQGVGALVTLSAYYIIGIPLGLILTFYFNLHLTGLWTGLTAALVYSAGVSVWTGVVQADWEVEGKRAQARVESNA
ncbi:MATE efflux family protein [Scleroderma citrinum]